LPERWLTSCPRGAIGVHPSLLPRHRGPDPFFWAIDAGDELTGVTLHTLSAQYDRGGILSQQSLAVGTQSAWQLARALDRPSLVALREGVRAIAEGRPPRAEPQDEAFASWAPEPTGELLRVDFHWPTERALRRIRALSPVPGLALEIRGVAFSVIAAERSERVLNALEPGEAGVLSDPPTLIIRTADGAIAIHRAQLSGEETETIDGAALAELIASKPAREP
jgi:methionyl-tRNA formyltransferase